MPRVNGKPVLNKPFKSKQPGKKYSVYVKTDNTKGYKIIHFGAAGMDDWRSGTATPAQRKSYLARAKGIKNKKGELTYKDKSSANYWSVNYLW
mgnify:FL=1|tara:strand:- start:209 stop:487 length:279 start_codon:yes stop_codon:yes gene_type:complete